MLTLYHYVPVAHLQLLHHTHTVLHPLQLMSKMTTSNTQNSHPIETTTNNGLVAALPKETFTPVYNPNQHVHNQQLEIP